MLANDLYHLFSANIDDKETFQKLAVDKNRHKKTGQGGNHGFASWQLAATAAARTGLVLLDSGTWSTMVLRKKVGMATDIAAAAQE